jgi:hypothetical protein
VDDQVHPLVCTPNSVIAQEVLRSALETGDLYQIGVAAHTYCDTWAHQNFVGIHSEYNSLEGFPESLIPNVGHADAVHKPDTMNLVWEDSRMVNSTVDNTSRFLEAACHLLAWFRNYNQEGGSVVAPGSEKLCSAAGDLKPLRDILQAIPGHTKNDRLDRQKMYCELSERVLGVDNSQPPVYNKCTWIMDALEKKPQWIRKNNQRNAKSELLYHWGVDNPDSTHWYKFQEAAKDYHCRTRDIITDHNPAAAQWFSEFAGCSV